MDFVGLVETWLAWENAGDVMDPKLAFWVGVTSMDSLSVLCVQFSWEVVKSYKAFWYQSVFNSHNFIKHWISQFRGPQSGSKGGLKAKLDIPRISNGVWNSCVSYHHVRSTRKQGQCSIVPIKRKKSGAEIYKLKHFSKHAVYMSIYVYISIDISI